MHLRYTPLKFFSNHSTCSRRAAIFSRSIRLIHNHGPSTFGLLFDHKGPSILATNLIMSYFNEGSVQQARILFDEMPERDVVAWTAMISGYASCNAPKEAWMVFVEMLREKVEPNAFTISSSLKACKGLESYSHGASVHGFALKCGLVGFIYVANALMDVYATYCVSMTEACMIFSDIHAKSAVSWTTIITGYTHRGDAHSALGFFKQMLYDKGESSPFTFSIAIRACSSIRFGACGKQIHAAVIKYGLGYNIPIMNSMLDMYFYCSSLSDATQCFDEMPEKDLITWNTLIAGHQKTNSDKSLFQFSRMEKEGFTPNCFTFTSIIAACANPPLVNCGRQVHGGVFSRGLDRNVGLANALIDMYAKCGNLVDSRKVFTEMSDRNLLSWTSMMIGYGTHGFGKEAVEMFDQMISSGVRPDKISFLAVLGACSHGGLVDDGLRHFNLMVGRYDISPDQEIYGCVVDLLGRAGRIEEAYELIKSMPFDPDESVWGAFLEACKTHKLVSFAKMAAQSIMALKPNKARTYVMLSNLYAADGKWTEFYRTRRLMKGLGSKKVAGRSWLELRN